MGMTEVAALLVGTSGLGSIGYLALQWRLRRRDREDFLLRMEILKINPTAEVLDNLTEGRWREHGCDSRPKCKRALVNDRGAGDGRLQSSAE